ncbi:MAG: hypothetical protein ISR64_08870 [Deltaproteobacteria bacterium]|nr:hypothetical protein [Deltaproteobacteria bacterium]
MRSSRWIVPLLAFGCVLFGHVPARTCGPATHAREAGILLLAVSLLLVGFRRFQV